MHTKKKAPASKPSKGAAKPKGIRVWVSEFHSGELGFAYKEQSHVEGPNQHVRRVLAGILYPTRPTKKGGK